MRDGARPPIIATFPTPSWRGRTDPDQVEAARRALPELPAQRKSRYMAEFGLPPYDAGVLTATRGMAEYFEACLKLYDDPKSLSNWIMGDFSAHLNAAGLEPQEAPLTPAYMAALLQMIDRQVISGKIARGDGEGLCHRQIPADRGDRGLLQITDQSELEKLVDEVIAANPDSVETYRGGKTKALGFWWDR